jgi:hypothetical protein
MTRRLLLLAALVVAALSVAIPLAGATPPEPISVALEETFTGSGVVGTFEASGGVFGSSTSGTMESVSYKPGGFSIPSKDHFNVFTATDQYTTSFGSFLVAFEGSCAVLEIDLDTLDATLACAGNWQVNGGTGDYARLKGTGTFDEVQNINLLDLTGDGTLELSGQMHTD